MSFVKEKYGHLLYSPFGFFFARVRIDSSGRHLSHTIATSPAMTVEEPATSIRSGGVVHLRLVRGCV